MERQLDTSYDATGNAIAENLKQLGKATCARVLTGTAKSVVYQGFVILPLKFLHSFFNKVGLIRNAYFKFAITTNLISRSTITTGTNGTLYTGLSSALSAKLCPYQITPLGAGVKGAAAGTTLTIESAIGMLDNTAKNDTFNLSFICSIIYIKC